MGSGSLYSRVTVETKQASAGRLNRRALTAATRENGGPLHSPAAPCCVTWQHGCTPKVQRAWRPSSERRDSSAKTRSRAVGQGASRNRWTNSPHWRNAI